MDHFSQLCLLEGKSHVDLRNLTLFTPSEKSVLRSLLGRPPASGVVKRGWKIPRNGLFFREIKTSTIHYEKMKKYESQLG